jgi:hypothetical protein
MPETKHFGLSDVRFRRGSIIKSVYVVVVIAIRLHQQQSDNLCKIKKKNDKWTGAIIYVAHFIVLLSSNSSDILRACRNLALLLG